MTNKERYQRAFSTLHASDRMMEVRDMKKTNRIYVKKFVPVLAAAVLTVAAATGAYAANLGGIKRAVQIWIHGDQTNAVMEVEDGSYTLTYTDKDGNVQERAGGGIAYEHGIERPLTAEELMEELDAPDVEYADDGTVMVYYHNQKIDITDKFENGICYVKLVEGPKTIYMTVKYQNGFSTSPDSYPNPREFN